MPRKPIGMDALELAARHLAGWSGSGQTWFADWKEVSTKGPDADLETAGSSDSLAIHWRGRVEEQAGVKSTTRVRRFHGWATHGGKVALPSHRPSRDAAGALSFAKLPGPLAPLLLLYACEDLRQWPTVEGFALACYPHPEAVGDAMRRIMWGSRGRFAPLPVDQRARQLGVRAETFRKRTRRAEAMLRDWLDRAAWAFLLAIGNPDERELQLTGTDGKAL